MTGASSSAIPPRSQPCSTDFSITATSSSAVLEAGERKRSYLAMRKTRNKERELFLIGFIALCQSRSFLVQTQRGILRHPASVLAPEPALGSLPSVALSSAQVGPDSNRESNRCCFSYE